MKTRAGTRWLENYLKGKFGIRFFTIEDVNPLLNAYNFTLAVENCTMGYHELRCAKLAGGRGKFTGILPASVAAFKKSKRQ